MTEENRGKDLITSSPRIPAKKKMAECDGACL